MTSAAHRLTIIIPAYNEERRIGPTLQAYAQYYDAHYAGQYDILVVLNGCRDNTEDVVKAAAAQYASIQYLNFSAPIGKGGAIIEGLKVANGELVAYTDADNSTRPEVLDELCTTLAHTPELDCVIGSRYMKESVVEKREFKRELVSMLGHFVVQIYFHLGIRDTQCGAKVVRRQMIPKILPYLSISNMAFDVNFLVDIKRAGGRILEQPIAWEDNQDSTITSPLKTSIAVFLSLTRLRIMYSPLKILYPVLKPISDMLHRLLTSSK